MLWGARTGWSFTMQFVELVVASKYGASQLPPLLLAHQSARGSSAA